MADFHVDIGGEKGVKPKFLILSGGVAWAFHLHEFARTEFRIPYEKIGAAAAPATIILAEELTDDRERLVADALI